MEILDQSVVRGLQHTLKAVAAVIFILILHPKVLIAQETILNLVKVRDDQNRPIYSEIFRFPASVPEKAHPLAETTEQGLLEISFKCKQGTRIQARPYSKSYTYSKKAYCRPSLELKVEPIRVVQRLQLNLDKALEANDYATATLIANELANIETRDGQGVFGAEAESFALVYATKLFSVEEGIVFDSAQNKVVMSRDLQGEIRQYQNENGLPNTGNLDYPTTSAIANTSSESIRYHIYEASDM